MNNKKNATFGIFKNKKNIDEVKEQLKGKGFSDNEIKVLGPNYFGPKKLEHQTRTMIISGAFIGMGIAVAFYFILFLFMASGFFSSTMLKTTDSPSMQMLIALGALFSFVVFGAVGGALVGIGTPREAKERLGDYVNSGGVLMSVDSNSPEETKKAREALDAAGGNDITVLEKKASWRAVYKNVIDKS